MKAIDLCIARFDDDTKEAFLDLYSKVDAGVEIPTTDDEDFGPKEFDESD